MKTSSSISGKTLDIILGNTRPFLLLRNGDSQEIEFLSGPVQEGRFLDDIPIIEGPTDDGKDIIDTVSMLPYRLVEERGYPARHANEPIITMRPDHREQIDLSRLLQALPDIPLGLDGEMVLTPNDADFARRMFDVQKNEIGKGQGCNFVLPQCFSGKIANFRHASMLTAFSHLLNHEYGAYATYLYSTGKGYFIAASPEQNLAYRDNNVGMMAISGTLRKAGLTGNRRQQALLEFLENKKEIFELFMVTDEEAKKMAELCVQGGVITGPHLKEMRNVIHTEYRLNGRTALSPIECMRRSMFMTTVIGSPTENACRIVAKHDSSSRGYYSAAMMLMGRDESGAPFLDSSINIRMAQVNADGAFQARAGATLVRDSEIDNEVREVKAKAGGILAALGVVPRHAVSCERFGPEITHSPVVEESLNRRNALLNRTLMENQEGHDHTVPELAGKTAVIINNVDDFAHTLGHCLRKMGMDVRETRYDAYDGDTHRADLVILGPGTGDPTDPNDPKMQRLLQVCEELQESHQPFMGVCLGHQIICQYLGIGVARKDDPAQGVQKEITLDGQRQLVGFYNTFAGNTRHLPSGLPAGLQIDSDPITGEIHAMRGPGFASAQFHPESILTQNGMGILAGIARHAMRKIKKPDRALTGQYRPGSLEVATPW